MKTLLNVFEELDNIDAPEIIEMLVENGLDVSKLGIVESPTLHFCLSHPYIGYADREVPLLLHFYNIGEKHFNNPEEAEQLNSYNAQAYSAEAALDGCWVITVKLTADGKLTVVSLEYSKEHSTPYRASISEDIDASDEGNCNYLYKWRDLFHSKEDKFDYYIDLNEKLDSWDKVALAEVIHRDFNTKYVESDINYSYSRFFEQGSEVFLITTVDADDSSIGLRPEDILSTAQLYLTEHFFVGKDPLYLLAKLGHYDAMKMRIELVEYNDNDMVIGGLATRYGAEMVKAGYIYQVMLPDMFGNWPTPGNEMFESESGFGQY